MGNKNHYLKRELNERLMNDPSLFEWFEDGSLDGVWFWDLENPEEEWLSPKFKQVFGYQDKEIPNTSSWWQQNIFKEDLPAVLENFEKHCADPNHPYDQVVRYKHKNGQTVWVRCRGKVIFNKAGKPIRMIGAHIDLTPLMVARQKQDQLLKELESWAGARQSVFDSMLDSIIVINETGTITEVNKATCNTFGFKADELIGENIKLLMGEEDADSHDMYLKHHIEKGVANIIGKGREVLAKKRSGDLFYAHLSIAKFSQSGSFRFVGTLKNIDAAVRERKELERSAFIDHLTGISSRKLMEQHVELAISQSIRNKQTFSVCFIDLNKFKPVNDTHGHDVGDSVLKIVAQRIQHAIRDNDSCARFGGDEFVVMSAPTSTRTCTKAIQEKLSRLIARPMHVDGLTLEITASIGTASYPDDGATLEALFSCADKRMYATKKSPPLLKIVSSELERDLIAITYISHSIISDKDLLSECAEIEQTASLNNANKKISGILLLCRHRFIQRLEGPRQDVDALLEKIKRDKRHRNFSLLSYSSISKRDYTDWSHMRVVAEDSKLCELEDVLNKLELSDGLTELEASFFIDFIRNFNKTEVMNNLSNR